MTKPIRAGLALVATLAVLAFLVPSQIATAADSRSTGSAATRADDDPSKLMLVLDSSGSMKEQASGGETKIVAAKKALTAAIDKLPADQAVGLRVFGAKVFSRKDPGACTDSQLVTSLGTDNRDKLRTAVSNYRPYGETPIGYALEQAGKDLGNSGKRNIVLVSDGVPTCQPDPCEVAKKLSKNGIDLKIDVVGLDVNSRARSALECIAKAGHGVYYDVDNSKDFADSLIKVTERAARPYAAVGKPVTGSQDAPSAPAIQNGDWLDKTEPRATKYYKIERKYAGSTIHFSAAFQDPSTAFNTVTLKTEDGDTCDASGDVDVLGANSLVAAAATAGPITSLGDLDAKRPCAADKSLIAEVTYTGDSTGIPVELRVTELPPVENFDSLPKPADAPSWQALPTGTATTVQGGSSFTDAAPVTAGVYRGNLVRGETQTFKVKLDWGQQLTTGISYPELPGPKAAAVDPNDTMSVQVFAPTRKPASGSADDAPSGYTSTNTAMFARGGGVGEVTGPVRFRNSAASNGAVQGADTAGEYTVVVNVSKSSGKSIPIPFTMKVGVSGQVAGAPQFAAEPENPEKKAPAGSTGTGGSAKGGDSGGGFPTGPVLGGLGAVALLAAGALFLRSRAN